MGTEDKRDESIGAEPAQPQRPAMTLPAAHRVRSFAERMSRIKEITGNRYNAVKNKLVAYKTVARKPKWVRPRVTNSGETFSLGRKMLGKICLVSGYLRLFLAMDPKQFNFDKYHHKDYSGVARYTQFPLMIKLSSDRQVRYALELIGILMQENGLEPDPDYVEQDYVPYFLQFAPEDGVESELWTDDDDLGFDDDDDDDGEEEEPEGDYVEEDDVVQGAAAFAMGLAAGGADGEGAEEAAAAEPEEVSEEAAPEEAEEVAEEAASEEAEEAAEEAAAAEPEEVAEEAAPEEAEEVSEEAAPEESEEVTEEAAPEEAEEVAEEAASEESAEVTEEAASEESAEVTEEAAPEEAEEVAEEAAPEEAEEAAEEAASEEPAATQQPAAPIIINVMAGAPAQPVQPVQEAAAPAEEPEAPAEEAAPVREEAPRPYRPAEHGCMDVRLPKRGTVVNQHGDKIGRIRKSVWYDSGDTVQGAFVKDKANVYLVRGEQRTAYLDNNDNVFTLSNGYMATIRRMWRFPLLLLLILLLVATAFAFALSAYAIVFSENANDIPVLFLADEEGTSWEDTENLPVFRNEEFGDTVIAPGMKGTYRFIFENRNESQLTYSLSFSEDNTYGIGLRYRLRRDGAYVSGTEGYVAVEELGLGSLTIEAKSSTVFELEWYWEDNDAVDTAAGENNAVYTLNITLLSQISA